MDIRPLLDELGVDPTIGAGGDLAVFSPIDGSLIGRLATSTRRHRRRCR